MSNINKDIYAIYIRVSTEKQFEHGDSIETQEELGLQIIKENNGIHYKTYIEPAISASKTSFKDRPVLMECLNDAKNGLFNKLIVYKRDRLARRLEDTMAIWDILKKANCELIFSATGEMQAMMNDPYGKMLEAIKASIAEIESATISVRVADNLKQKAKRGEFTGGNLPYGYMLKNGEIILIEDEVKIIKEIEDLYLAGYGLFSIAKWLNGEKVNNLGYRPEGRVYRRKQHKRSSEYWTKDVISTILFNPFYTGIIEYSTSGNRRLLKDDSLIIKAKGKHTPCRTFERHEQILQEKRRRDSEISEPRRYTTSFLLTGLLYCSECNNKFFGRNSTKSNGQRYSYYVCGGKALHIGKEPCLSKSYKKEILDEIILQQIIEYISNINLDDGIEILKEKLSESETNLKNEIENMNKKIERLNKDYAAIMRLLLDLDENDENYSLFKETYQSNQAEILKQLNEAKKDKKLLEEKLEIHSKQENFTSEIIKEIKNFSNHIKDTPFHKKKVMLDKIIDRIEIDKNSDVKIYLSAPLIPIDKHKKEAAGKISFISFGGVGDTTTTKTINNDTSIIYSKSTILDQIENILMKVKTEFIEWLKTKVEIKTARQLQKDANISETTARYIKNKKSVPTTKTIKKIINAYNLDINDFINYLRFDFSENVFFEIINNYTKRTNEVKSDENGRFN